MRVSLYAYRATGKLEDCGSGVKAQLESLRRDPAHRGVVGEHGRPLEEEEVPKEEAPKILRSSRRARRPPGIRATRAQRVCSKRRVDQARRSAAESATHQIHAPLRHHRHSTIMAPRPLARRVETLIHNPLLVTARELDALEILFAAEQDR